MVRGWLDCASVSVPQLHQRLTPEHFMDGRVPLLRQLRDQLAGEGLGWDLVEAVSDLCFPREGHEAAAAQLDQARELWNRAQDTPTPVGGFPAETVSASALLEAQDRTIRAYEEMERARRAYMISEQGRHQALQIAMYLFGMLGQANSKVAELRRRVDSLQSTPTVRLGELETARRQLERAQEQEEELRGELARAECERDTAQQVADLAARRVHDLERELSRLRHEDHVAGGPGAGTADTVLPATLPPGIDGADAELDEVDELLKQVRIALDREHDTIRDAADEIGWSPLHSFGSPGVVPGEVVERESETDGPYEELSGTTPNNPEGARGEGLSTELVPRVPSGDRLRYVGAATRRISRGIDLDEIVLGLIRSAVPFFADSAVVYLRDPLPVGDEQPVGPVVLRLRRTEPSPNPDTQLTPNMLCEIRSESDLAIVLRGVRPVFALTSQARSALGELLRHTAGTLSGRRVIIAPLRGRRRVLGVAVFVRDPGRRSFGEEDLVVAAQLASQTALGIDKAVLYGREAYIADELQRVMLPYSLPQPAGVRLAFRYLPAAETARAGGDWYESIPLPGSRVALVVGDVLGHSMTSAAIMGQLRSTATTLAQLDLPPTEVLHHLDEQAQRLGPERLATCLYAVYDPVAARITLASAGHPPPVLLHSHGRAEVLRVPVGPPIGVGGVDFEAVDLDAPAGGTLLLYTDGLVESRLRDVWTGIEQLRERLATTAHLTGRDHPPPLEALCDDVLDILGPGDRDDDIVLLAARFDGIDPSDVAYWSLDPEETAPGQARRFARRALTQWGLEELSESLELLVSEVVTNAIRYSERPVTLRLLRTDVLRCEVGDDSPQLPRQRQPRDADAGGRGLVVVSKLARNWGATRLSSGKVVWFELPLPAAHRHSDHNRGRTHQ
ncbi:SpoIIE family protein phosphatase [Streptomyces sp. NPDC090085]|uniref:SpoIIE family protein phosphatase n=1 Tax=Streptomyces sp. NPDC090085 TaxID=3365943 RepID=UPI0037FCEB41